MNDVSGKDDQVEAVFRIELYQHLVELVKLNPDMYGMIAESMLKHAPKKLPALLQGLTLESITATLRSSPALTSTILAKIVNTVQQDQLTKRSNQAYRRILQLKRR